MTPQKLGLGLVPIRGHSTQEPSAVQHLWLVAHKARIEDFGGARHNSSCCCCELWQGVVGHALQAAQGHIQHSLAPACSSRAGQACPDTHADHSAAMAVRESSVLSRPCKQCACNHLTPGGDAQAVNVQQGLLLGQELARHSLLPQVPKPDMRLSWQLPHQHHAWQ